MSCSSLFSAHRVLSAELPHLDPVSRRVLRAVLLLWGPWIEVRLGHRLTSAPEPAIFALSHNNTVESVLAPAILLYLRDGRPVRFLIDWMYLHLPPMCWITGLGGCIPVFTKPAKFRLRERFRLRHRRRSPLVAALERLEAGESVGIFPEGTRNRDSHELLAGRRGIGRLALSSGAPVVPVGLDYPARQRLGRLPPLGRPRLIPGLPRTL